MMRLNNRIWFARTDPNTYRSFGLIDYLRSTEFLDILASTARLKDTWEPQEVCLFAGDDLEDDEEVFEGYIPDIDRPLGDFLSYGIMIASNKHAREILEALIANTVEFLPLKTDLDYFVLHADMIDCLDIPHSVVKRFRSSGRIMDVVEYAFHWEQLEGIHMFRIPEAGKFSIFVSDDFKRVVEENDLKGLIFNPIVIAES